MTDHGEGDEPMSLRRRAALFCLGALLVAGAVLFSRAAGSQYTADAVAVSAAAGLVLAGKALSAR
jgi:hypothetical protein